MINRETLLRGGASILISFGLFIAVAQKFTTTTAFFEARINYENYDQSKIRVVAAPSTVKVEAKGAEDYLKKLDPASVSVVVDLSNARTGRHVYAVKGSSTSRVTITPKFPEVQLDIQEVSSREQTVVVEEAGLPESSFIFKGALVDPRKVMITGAKDYIALVAKARVLLYLKQVKPGESLTIPVDLLDDQNRPVPYVRCEPVEVTVSPSVLTASPLKKLLVSPSWIGQPAFGYRVKSYSIEPHELSIRGNTDVLLPLTTVMTEPISVDGLTEDKVIVAKVKLPAGTAMNGRPNESDPDSQQIVEVKVTVKIEPARGPGKSQN